MLISEPIEDLNSVKKEQYIVLESEYEENLLVYGFIESVNIYKQTVKIFVTRYERNGKISIPKPEHSLRTFSVYEDYTLYNDITIVPREWRKNIADFALDTDDKLWFYQLTS